MSKDFLDKEKEVDELKKLYRDQSSLISIQDKCLASASIQMESMQKEIDELNLAIEKFYLILLERSVEKGELENDLLSLRGEADSLM